MKKPFFFFTFPISTLLVLSTLLCLPVLDFPSGYLLTFISEVLKKNPIAVCMCSYHLILHFNNSSWIYAYDAACLSDIPSY